MVVLLTISTLAAALVPPPQESQESSSTTTATSTTTEATTDEPKADDLIRAEVPVPKGDEAPRQVDVEPGDQLALTVTSGEAGEVSLPDFGLVEFAGPGNPATFNVLVEESGQFPIRFAGAGVVATIVSQPERPAREREGK